MSSEQSSEAFGSSISNEKQISPLKDALKNCYTNLNRYRPNFTVPIVPLVQSSGTGKSRIALKLLSTNPGFYFNMSGHESNEITKELFDIFTGRKTLIIDEVIKDEVDLAYHCFAKAMTIYIQTLVENAIVIKSLQNLSNENSIKHAIEEMEKTFMTDSRFSSFKHVSDEFMIEKYLEQSSTKNSRVLSYIQQLSNDSKSCLELCSDSYIKSQQEEMICILINNRLKNIPFLFIFDDVDSLSSEKCVKMETDNKQAYGNYNGKDSLFHALVHSKRNGNSNSLNAVFLVITSMSTIYEPTPEALKLDFYSSKQLYEPFYLNLTLDSFANRLPISELIPSYDLLRNPLLFKFLTTLGRPLWASVPFERVVDFADEKLNTSIGFGLLPIWLILTGLAPDIFNTEALSLAQNHLAMVFKDYFDTKAQALISYPSEPILALAANKILSNVDKLTLMQSLMEHIGIVAFVRREINEAYVAMVILLAFIKTPVASDLMKCDDADSYNTCLESIIYETDNKKFNVLWNRHQFLLEPADGHVNYCFPYYKIYTVRDFLKVWSGKEDFDLESYSVSEDVLDGFVNATHFIHLITDTNGRIISPDDPLLRADEQEHIQLADERIMDDSRNVITQELVKSGLLRQCGFFLPARYFGINLIIPVCMKNNGGFTFISVQVKTEKSNSFDDTFMTQSRLHYVKCRSCEDAMENCDQCVKDEILKKIYENQISIAIYLNDNEFETKLRPFKDEISFFKGCDIGDKEKLESALKTNILKPLMSKNYSYITPLIRKSVFISEEMKLIIELWNNDVVDDLNQNVLLVREGQNYRQFCICIRGWKHLRRFLPDDRCVKEAKYILGLEGIFRFKKSGSDIDDN